MPLTHDDVRAAAKRIAGVVRLTPVVQCDELCRAIGAKSVVLKCENLQVGGAFKYRGASNAILASLERGPLAAVATHSSGNHAAALALAARRAGVKAFVVVPTNCNSAKRRAAHDAGAIIETSEPTLAAREAAVAALVLRTSATLIHPYDDDLVIAGQGTAALELLQTHPALDVIVVPVSGGGLLSGTALAAHGTRAGIEVIGAEPLLADDAARSLAEGRLVSGVATASQTMADGLRAALCPRTFAIVREQVSAILTVSEAQIAQAMKLVWDHLRLLIEPSSAVAIAALAAEPERFRGKSVGIIVSGGNVDLHAPVPWQQPAEAAGGSRI